MSLKRIVKLIVLTLFTTAIQAPQKPTHKTYIFSWCTVFTPDEKDIEQRVKKRLGLLRSIGVLFQGIPENKEVKKQLFELLGQIEITIDPIEQKTWTTEYPSWEIDYELPPIFAQYLVTSTLEDEQKVYQKIIKHLENAAISSNSRRRILLGIADFIFQSQFMNTAMDPVQDMLKLAQELKQQGHTVLLIGNVPGYAWDTFLEKFEKAQVIKDIFSPNTLFISGKEQQLKTSQALYKKMMAKHAINPSTTTIIDCNENNLRYAKKIGMKTLIVNPKNDSIESIREKLT